MVSAKGLGGGLLPVAVFTALLVACGTTDAAAQNGKTRVAVVDFENNSTWTWWGRDLGRAAADELTTQLFQGDLFSIVERDELDAILTEQNLGAGGRISESTAAQIGQLLGAQLILTGSISQFSIERVSGGFRRLGLSVSQAETRLGVRVLDTNTGEVVFAAEGDGRKRFGSAFFQGVNIEREFDAGFAGEALRPAIEKVVEKINGQRDRFSSLQSAAPAGRVVGSGEGGIFIDRGDNYGLQIGQRFEVHRVVDEIRDSAGRLLDQVTEPVGVLEVTRVLSQSAICQLLEGEARDGDTVRGF